MEFFKYGKLICSYRLSKIKCKLLFLILISLNFQLNSQVLSPNLGSLILANYDTNSLNGGTRICLDCSTTKSDSTDIPLFFYCIDGQVFESKLKGNVIDKILKNRNTQLSDFIGCVNVVRYDTIKKLGLQFKASIIIVCLRNKIKMLLGKNFLKILKLNLIKTDIDFCNFNSEYL